MGAAVLVFPGIAQHRGRYTAAPLPPSGRNVRAPLLTLLPQASVAGTNPPDSRLRGNESITQDAPSVISVEAGIRKRERFFVTLHNTSWIRDHCPLPEISSVRGGPCRRRVAAGRWLVDGDRRNGAFARRTVLFGPRFDPGSTRYGEPADGPGARPSGGSAHRADTVEPAAGLAQWVEQLLCKHQVVSSSLTAGTIPPAPGGGLCGAPAAVPFRRNPPLHRT